MGDEYFDRIYEEYSGWIIRLLHWRVVKAKLNMGAEDFVSDVLIKGIKSIKKNNKNPKDYDFRNVFRTIAIRDFITEVRKSKTLIRAGERDAERLDQDDESGKPNMDRIEKKLLMNKPMNKHPSLIEDILDNLGKYVPNKIAGIPQEELENKLREIVMLYLQGFNLRETAKITGIKYSKVTEVFSKFIDKVRSVRKVGA
jgi:DNA-directed RNA polymerase specialized sigma24 family protein